jgi:predicted metal-dependent phosphoesterase TrpH
VRIDLHTHSTASDGTDPPAEVMRRAAGAGLDVVALTDHDTMAGHAEAARALPAGLSLVPGLELSCRSQGHSVHLLAYWADPANPDLAAECAAIRDGRTHRAQAMVAKLQALGAGVTWDQVSRLAGGGVVGRPHIARAMAAAGVIASPAQAFTPEWIAPGGRAYVSRYAPDPVAAIRLVRAAGGVTVLAHPAAADRGWRLPGEEIGRLAEAGLAGLEVAHPGHSHDQRRWLADLAAGLGLVACGGSDDHGSLTGYRIGCELTAPAEYERLRSLARAVAGPVMP